MKNSVSQEALHGVSKLALRGGASVTLAGRLRRGRSLLENEI